MASTSGQYQGLAFSFAQTLDEIENVKHLVKDFIDATSLEFVLPQFQNSLRIASYSREGGSLVWCIPEESPIRTVCSDGEFEQAGRKGIAVYGTLSTVWEIAWQKKAKEFLLAQNASTKLRVFEVQDDEEDGREIARWRFEIGVASSPGCHFHTQVLQDEADAMFPHRLSVPRLPSILLAPMDGLDFLLGELFQERWRQKSSEISNDHLRVWAKRQRVRLRGLLQWKLETIEKDEGSPWMVLKKEKPLDVNMLLEKKR